MRIRVKFSKNGAMRFVGHLDFMRYFQKALRRAGIDLVYSEGFHPHPLLSFAAPLGLGLTSDGEYMDFEVHTSAPSTEAIETINSEMAEGVVVTEYLKMDDNAKKAMACVAAADYLVYFKHEETLSQSEIADAIDAYYRERESIEVTKPTKKGERVVDLKPLLYRMEPYSDDGVSSVNVSAPGQPEILSDLGVRKGFFLRLSTGSTENVKPELVLSDLYAFLGLAWEPENLMIHRIELYERQGSDFMPLCAAGEEISCHQGS